MSNFFNIFFSEQKSIDEKLLLNLVFVKRLIASFLLLFFSLQIFPVLEIGKVMFKKELTEQTGEFESSTDDVGIKLKKDDSIQKTNLTKREEVARYYNLVVAIALQGTEALPQSFVPDILTPPPNWAFS